MTHPMQKTGAGSGSSSSPPGLHPHSATSPLSKPPVYPPHRIPSPALHVVHTPTHMHGGARPIPVKTPRRASQPSTLATSTSTSMSMSASAGGSASLTRSRYSLSPRTPSSPHRHHHDTDPHPHPHPHSQSPSSPPPHSFSPASGPHAHPGSPPLSRSHPLLGSYQLSLLHSRMSHAHPPHSLPSTSTSAFTLVLGAVGKGRTCPHDLRCPPHIQIPFSATYYDLEHASARGTSTSSPGRGAVQTPWTATIDLESHYFDAYATSPVMTASASTFQLGSSFPPSGGPAGPGGPGGPGGHGRLGGHGLSVTPSRPAPPPPYPGYRVAPVGQLQLLVKSPSSAVKVFLVPYDLRDLPVGGRLLARERTWVETAPAPPTPADASTNAQSTPSALPASTASTSPPLTPCSPPVARRESLRYALQLQFICVESDEPPSSSASPAMPESATTRHRAVSASASLPGISSHPTQSVSDGQTDQSMPTRKAYYVSKSIKVIFASNPPEKDEITRTERADELVPPPTPPSTPQRPQRPAAVGASAGGTNRLVKGFSPSSVGRAGEWDLLRKKWEARQQVQATLASSGTAVHPTPTPGTHIPEAATPTPTSTANSTQTPTPTSISNSTASAAASSTSSPTPRLGLGYSFNRQPIPPVSPVSSPLSAPIPLPLLSPAAKFAQGRALPTIESRDTSRSSSPGPSSNGASAGSNGSNGPNGFPQRTASPQPPSIRIPVAQRYTRTKLRRGSGSIEERELSEKLRAMRMTTAEQDQEQERGIPGAPGTPGAPE